MDGLSPEQFQERYDDVTADPDRVARYANELMSEADFAKLFHRLVVDLVRNAEFGGIRMPREAHQMADYPEGSVRRIQKVQRLRWGDMQWFIEEMGLDPKGAHEMSTKPPSARSPNE